MPNLYANFLRGTLTADPGAGGATLTSAELASMATFGSPDFMWVTLDPAGINGAPEIVKITTHTAAATTAAMSRGQQGTTARAHPVGTAWRQTWTRDDALLVREFSGLEAALPTASAALKGYSYYATDTNRVRLCDGTGWVIMSEPAQSYTPTWTGLTVGNATQSFTYHRSDGFCEIDGTLTLGGTSSVGGIVGLSVPTGTDLTAASVAVVGYQAWISDASPVTTYPALVFAGSATRFDLYTYNAAAAASATLVASGTSAPMTWAVSDQIRVAIRWRMASRYG